MAACFNDLPDELIVHELVAKHLSTEDVRYTLSRVNHRLHGLAPQGVLGANAFDCRFHGFLRKCVHLRYLSHSTCRDSSYAYWPELTRVTLSIGATDAALILLPRLTYLDLCQNSTVTVRGLTALTSLNLGYNINIGDTVLALLTRLTTLILASNSTITDAGIMGLTQLTRLSLGLNKRIAPRVTDAGIKGLTQLTRLMLDRNMNITDNGIMGLTLLTTLGLGFNRNITDRGVAPLTDLRIINTYRSWSGVSPAMVKTILSRGEQGPL